MPQIEKSVLLQSVDRLWREHLVTLDHLRSVIGWRGFAQRDPLNEYKQEAFDLFQAMLVQPAPGRHRAAHARRDRPRGGRTPEPELPPMAMHHMDETSGFDEFTAAMLAQADGQMAISDAAATGERDPNDPRTWGKVGRNEACPCGSGKKYKHCHGAFV